MIIGLKLSGEAMGNENDRWCLTKMTHIAREIHSLVEAGHSLVIVVGGGNIFRGKEGKALGFDRVVADYNGMTATMMNGSALQQTLNQLYPKIKTSLMTARPYPDLGELYVYKKAKSALAKGKVLILSGGTGNALCTTDFAIVQRSVELGCDIVLKSTQVDGVYDSDPVKNPTAQKYDTLLYDDAIARGLEVMDLVAFAHAKVFGIPIRVFCGDDLGSFLAAAQGNIGTLVYKEK